MGRRADRVSAARRFDPEPGEHGSGRGELEKSTLTEVTNARASVGRVTLDPNKAPTDAAQFGNFRRLRGSSGNALSRLLVVSENYRTLKSNQNFLGLQAQLEGTENRISVERNNYNEVVQRFNTAVRRFQHADSGHAWISPRPFFNAQAGADRAPTVNFNFGTPAPAGSPVPAATAAATP